MLVFNRKTQCLQIQANNAPVRVRHGARLPHLSKTGGTYSVTFRLADSLPKAVVDSWVRERENILATARQMDRGLTDEEQQRLNWLFRERVDSFLNAGRGECWLAEDEIAHLVQGTFRHFDADRYDLICWSIMPNHAHAIVHPREGCELETIMHSWKSYSSQHANRILGRSGQFWAHESYDHLVRDDHDLWHSVKYTLANPRKAALEPWSWKGAKVEAAVEGVKVLADAVEQFRELPSREP